MFRSAFFRRLFLPYLLLVCLAIAAVGVFAGMRLRTMYFEQRRQALHEQSLIASELLRDKVLGRNVNLDALVKRLGDQLDCRVTVIAEDGAVLADNWADPSQMDNHAARPEVLGALREGEGISTRRSSTVRNDMLYFARRLSDPPAYLRLAVRVQDVNNQLRNLYLALGAIALATMAAAAAILFHFARRQALPVVELKAWADSIASGDLSEKSVTDARGELASVSTTLNTMSQSIRELVMKHAGGKAELLTILSSMSEGVIATDAEQQIVLVNDAAAELIGFNRMDSQGKPLWQVVRIDRIIKSAQEVLATGEKRAFELGMVRGRHLEVSVGPYPAHAETKASRLEESRNGAEHGPNGEGTQRFSDRGVILAEAPKKVEGIVVVIHDTTQSVRYQELRREFVANVSHELRTPLTVIKGFVETLRDGAINDPRRGPEYLATIERHTNQLTNLVNDLLELSRLESQADVPRRVSVDLAAIARRAAETLSPAAQKKHQTLTIEAHRVPLIAGNPDYLERAVSNLIDNAVKYTPDGGRITVVTRPGDHGAAPGVIVEVADNGIGIPREDIPRIFERFYRVDRSRSRDMGGTGLGLSIVKHIAQGHGGSVEVESTVGQGSTFRLKMPVVQEED